MDLISLVVEQFFETLELHKIKMKNDERLIMDGRIHRFATADDKRGERSGGYYIHLDGCPNWGVIDYRSSTDGVMIKEKFHPKSDSPEDRREFFSVLGLTYETSEERREKKRREEQSREEARKRAYDEYMRATHEGVAIHPYCRLKRLENLTNQIKVVSNSRSGDVCRDGDLLIPLININSRKFQSLQRISYNTMSNGKHMKGIYPNTVLSNSCYIFQETHYPSRIIVCEGFATGASIFSMVKQYNDVVVASMTCSNMLNIAKEISCRYRIPLVIGADNDEAGMRTADSIVAKGYASAVYAPPIAGYDWNDFVVSNLLRE